MARRPGDGILPRRGTGTVAEAMSKEIHVAMASTTSKPGDVAGNLAQIETSAQRAAADGVVVGAS